MDLELLLEEWKDSVKMHSYVFDIFKNPTPKELAEAAKQNQIRAKNMIRFIIDVKNKDFYVFSHLLLHNQAAKRLKFSYPPFNANKSWKDTEYIYSVGTVKKGKIFLNKEEIFSEAKQLIRFLKDNKEFTNKYFTFSEVLEEEFETKLSGVGIRNGNMFVNPTMSEMDSVAIEFNGNKYIRFIASPKRREVYVFSPSILHRVANRFLKLEGSKSENLWGVAKKQKGKWIMSNSDSYWYFDPKLKRHIEKMLWFTRFIDPTKFLKLYYIKHNFTKDGLLMEPEKFIRREYREIKKKEKGKQENKKSEYVSKLHKKVLLNKTVSDKNKTGKTNIARLARNMKRMNLKEMLENIDRAKEYAEKQHQGQTRMDGTAYVGHPKRVAEIVKKYKQSHKIDDLIKAALLHDTIEDTNTTEEDLKKMFGGLVASLVKELTSSKEEIRKVGKANYLANKMLNMSSWALVLKLSDRLDNVSDLHTAKESFAKRYKRETEKILDILERERKLSKTQKRLVVAIKNKLGELSQ